MALVHLSCHSDVLHMGVSVDVILPQATASQIGMDGTRTATFPTLYLLHGLSDDHTAWSRRTAVERYATRYGVAVVMPAADRSFYTDMAAGPAYYTYIARELPALCRSFFSGMSEETYIAGLSMGGYGAWKIAMREGGFAGVASFSGALDVCDLATESALDTGRFWQGIFGDIEKLPGSPEDVYAVTKEAIQNGNCPDKLYLACGTEDWLLPATRKMKDLLDAHRTPCVYREAPGNHNWDFWDAELERAMAFFFVK